MLQQILSSCESLDSDLSVFLDSRDNTYCVYVGVALIECVSVDPAELTHKMLIGRLCNGGAKLCVLTKQFNHDSRTIKKWADALLSGNFDDLVEAFLGKKIRKTTPELIAYVKQQYRNRAQLPRYYREIIIDKTEEVFGIRISKTLASNIFREVKEAPEIALEHEPIQSEKVDVAVQSAPQTASSIASTIQTSTCFPFMAAGGNIETNTWIQHAGLVVFGFALQGYDSFQCQLIYQLLLGAVNIEQSKSLCHRSMSFFSRRMISTLRLQRTQMDLEATKENTLELYRKNSELLSDGPNKGKVFLFDPHTKDYTGALHILKGWCGSQHSVRKVMNLDSFHTVSGRPCFIQHYCPYDDMRERFFASLKSFDLLFDEDKRSGRTFVIDRGIFGLECFSLFGNDHLITWEKGYDGGGWDEGAKIIEFTRARHKNDRRKTKKYTFRCQESVWEKADNFRKVIVQATNDNGRTITVSVLCSHPTMGIQDLVWYIFNRWLQENDFKYLDENYGINQLDSRAHVSFAEKADEFKDRDAESAEYRLLKKLANEAGKKLAKSLLKLNQAEKKRQKTMAEIDVLSASTTDGDAAEGKKAQHRLSYCKKVISKTEDQIIVQEKELEEAGEKQLEAIKTESRIQQVIDGNYQLLDARRKSYMDALRVTASNIFRNVHDKFRVMHNNHRDDHVRLRMLTRCSGLIDHSKGEVCVKLWLPGTLQKHVLESMENLVNSCAGEINGNSSPSDRVLRIELVTGPVKW